MAESAKWLYQKIIRPYSSERRIRSNKILSIRTNRLKLFEDDLFRCLIKIQKKYTWRGKSLFYFLKHFFFFLIRNKLGINLNLYNSRRKTDKNLPKIFEIPQIQIYSLSSKRTLRLKLNYFPMLLRFWILSGMNLKKKIIKKYQINRIHVRKWEWRFTFIGKNPVLEGRRNLSRDLPVNRTSLVSSVIELHKMLRAAAPVTFCQTSGESDKKHDERPELLANGWRELLYTGIRNGRIREIVINCARKLSLIWVVFIVSTSEIPPV